MRTQSQTNLAAVTAAAMMLAAPAVGQEDSAAAGRFLTVSGTVDENMAARITNLALELQNQANQENRDVLLVLEITGGSSSFGQIRDVAKFLVSTRLSRVKTIAWVPDTVTGNNAILALACNEIVMHADARLGDIGRGDPVDNDEQHFVIDMVSRRHNRMLTPGLAKGMMDPDVALKLVETQQADGSREVQVLTESDIKTLQNAQVPILDVRPVKEAGAPGVFSGEQAARNSFLVVRTAETRRDVADIYRLPVEAMREDVAAGDAVGARLIQINDVIEPGLTTFVERQIDRAVAGGATVIIFEVNSPGGLVFAGQQLADRILELEEQNVRSVAYVRKDAISMAAVISLACDEIYMHPDARIGDAGLIEVSSGEFRRVPEKLVSPFRTYLRTLAKRKGRSEALLLAMNDKDLKVYKATHTETGRVAWMSEAEIKEEDGKWRKGALVAETNEDLLLTVDGDRAHELGLAQAPVQDLDELKARIGIPADYNLEPVGMTWVDSLVFVLNTKFAMFWLIALGIVFIYIELHFLTGLFGIMSALCFGLFFWARFLGGTAGALELTLFALGLVCIALEFFVIPGFGVFGVSGGILMVVSIVMAANTFVGRSTTSNINAVSMTMGTLIGSVGCVVIAAMALNKFLPNLPFLNRMILTPPGTITDDPDSPRLRPEFTLADSRIGASQLAGLLGMAGVASTTLRPAGKAQIGDHFVDVVSDGPYINAGQPIEVVKVKGNRVIVRQTG